MAGLKNALDSFGPGRVGIACATAAIIVLLAATTPTCAFQLITEQEAALPADPLPNLDRQGSPSRGPSVTVVSPPPGAGLVHSPLDLKLIFQAHGGAMIDVDSVVVTYRKKPAIDITQRIKPFITADGIDVSQAEVPPGTHQFLVRLKDKDGRLGGIGFGFQVTK